MKTMKKIIGALVVAAATILVSACGMLGGDDNGQTGQTTSKVEEYLSFTAKGDNAQVSLERIGDLQRDMVLEYSFDRSSWKSVSIAGNASTVVIADLDANHTMYLRAKNASKSFSAGTDKYWHFVIESKAAAGNGGVELGGNVMSLLDPQLKTVEMEEFAFCRLFENNECILKAPLLPALVLSTGCYASMFRGCTRLSGSVGLPAAVLKNFCYSHMFDGCKAMNSLSVSFTQWMPESAVEGWLDGVAENGVFHCPKDLENERGQNRIPARWSVN